jgi:hypothetical protein
MFKKNHKDVMALIEKHNDDELLTKKKYHWTGTTSLGSYFISAASSHYDWGLKTIKPLKKLTAKRFCISGNGRFGKRYRSGIFRDRF